uniref:Uncharacterized protein n=1 Tax=viral metagenome TaxID=1070528 RepID=A0A6H1ZDS0_9ZZZZ
MKYTPLKKRIKANQEALNKMRKHFEAKGIFKPKKHDIGCNIQLEGECSCKDYKQNCPECHFEKGHSRECPKYTEPPMPELKRYEDLTHPITGERIPF